jgi:hypothetical protein
MTELLKKGVKFVWSEDCEKAFHTLRQHLTTAPVLVQLDSSKLFEVFCDARALVSVVFLCKKIESFPMPHDRFDPMK